MILPKLATTTLSPLLPTLVSASLFFLKNSFYYGELNNITEAIVAIEGFDHGEVTDCFNQIAVQLNIAIADLKVTVAAGVTLDLLLILNGVVCSLGDLAGVVYGLLFVRIGRALRIVYFVLTRPFTACHRSPCHCPQACHQRRCPSLQPSLLC